MIARYSTIIFCGSLAFAGGAHAMPQQAMFGRPVQTTPGATADCRWDIDNCFQQGRGVGPSTAFVTVTRASPELCSDINNYWNTVGNGVACIGRGIGVNPWEIRSNKLPNSTLQGAVSGVVGSGGSNPTGWIITAPTNITETVSLVTINNIPCIQMNFAGTAGSNSQILINFTDNSIIAAASGQIWTESAFVSNSAVTGVSQFLALGLGITSGGTTSGDQFTSSNIINGVFGRVQATGTLAQATTAFLRTGFETNTISSSTVVNFTATIGFAQQEANSYAGPPIPTINASVTRPADIITWRYMPQVGPGYALAYGGIPAAPSGTATGQIGFEIDDGTNNNRLVVQRNGGNGHAMGVNSSNNVTLNIDTGSVWPQNVFGKLAASTQPGAQSAYFNGANPVNTTGNFPIGVSIVRVGTNPFSNAQWNGSINRTRIFSTYAAQPQPLSR